MAFDNLKTYWHLTPAGWVEADEPPPDRVKTCCANIYQSSQWAKEEQRWFDVWEDPNSELARGLMERFGERPPGHENYEYRKGRP